LISKRLEELEQFGIKLGLENIRALLAAIGDPQTWYPSILIAGTNGKGSVGAMLAKILQTQGFRTGHYSSPHLVDVRERIAVDGEPISQDAFEEELTTVFTAIDLLQQNGQLPNPPTYFETLTGLGFRHFRNRKVDIAVVEVGLGGRYDATNVLNQILSIITTIDYDHEAYLGKTLAAIAFEKAGILRQGGQLVTGFLPIEASAVIHDAVGRSHILWRQADREDVQNLQSENGFPVFRYRPWQKTIRVNLRGKYQADNAAIALLACDALGRLGFRIEGSAAREALASVEWPGRLQMLSENPAILLDCAHNPMGVRSLSDFLKDIGWGKVIALFTAMKDKNYSSMLKTIAPTFEKIWLTRIPPLDRCADFDQLTVAAHSEGIRFVYNEDATEAFVDAREEAMSKKLPLVVFGSMYLIGQILKDHQN
jgi:dihydrofolate synthase / folylpolyglutamate synthase